MIPFILFFACATSEKEDGDTQEETSSQEGRFLFAFIHVKDLLKIVTLEARDHYGYPSRALY